MALIIAFNNMLAALLVKQLEESIDFMVDENGAIWVDEVEAAMVVA
jgi:hypothetical protein